jgi:hypothetical protein
MLGFVRPIAGHIHDRVRFGAKLIFWPLLILTLVAVALELGAWHTEFKIAGDPFLPFLATFRCPQC